MWVDINPRYSQNRLADRLSADLAITQGSLYNLLNTVPGDQSRIFRTDYGSHWKMFLQENINDVTAAQMELLLLDAIAKWEPRIKLRRDQSFVIPDFKLPGYKVRIVFLTPDDQTQQVTFDVPA
jgi:phage baseplate assembly protein W